MERRGKQKICGGCRANLNVLTRRFCCGGCDKYYCRKCCSTTKFKFGSIIGTHMCLDCLRVAKNIHQAASPIFISRETNVQSLRSVDDEIEEEGVFVTVDLTSPVSNPSPRRRKVNRSLPMNRPPRKSFVRGDLEVHQSIENTLSQKAYGHNSKSNYGSSPTKNRNHKTQPNSVRLPLTELRSRNIAVITNQNKSSNHTYKFNNSPSVFFEEGSPQDKENEVNRRDLHHSNHLELVLLSSKFEPRSKIDTNSSHSLAVNSATVERQALIPFQERPRKLFQRNTDRDRYDAFEAVFSPAKGIEIGISTPSAEDSGKFLPPLSQDALALGDISDASIPKYSFSSPDAERFANISAVTVTPCNVPYASSPVPQSKSPANLELRSSFHGVTVPEEMSPLHVGSCNLYTSEEREVGMSFVSVDLSLGDDNKRVIEQLDLFMHETADGQYQIEAVRPHDAIASTTNCRSIVQYQTTRIPRLVRTEEKVRRQTAQDSPKCPNSEPGWRDPKGASRHRRRSLLPRPLPPLHWKRIIRQSMELESHPEKKFDKSLPDVSCRCSPCEDNTNQSLATTSIVFDEPLLETYSLGTRLSSGRSIRNEFELDCSESKVTINSKESPSFLDNLYEYIEAERTRGVATISDNSASTLNEREPRVMGRKAIIDTVFVVFRRGIITFIIISALAIAFVSVTICICSRSSFSLQQSALTVSSSDIPQLQLQHFKGIVQNQTSVMNPWDENLSHDSVTIEFNIKFCEVSNTSSSYATPQLKSESKAVSLLDSDGVDSSLIQPSAHLARKYPETAVPLRLMFPAIKVSLLSIAFRAFILPPLQQLFGLFRRFQVTISRKWRNMLKKSIKFLFHRTVREVCLEIV